MKQNLEDNVGKFIKNVDPRYEDYSKFYIKDSIWKPSQGDGNNSSKSEILQDYLENTEYESYISLFLNKRLNWKQVPYDTQELDFSYTGPDQYVKLPSKYLTSDVWDELSKEEKEDIIEKVGLSKKKFSKGSGLNKDMQYKSRINNRIPKLTRLLGNKYTLYTLVQEYGKEAAQKTIPLFTIFNTYTQENFEDIVKKFVESSKSNVFILRPTSSLQGLGTTILTQEKLLKILPDYVSRKIKKNKYIRWIVSEFRESFLWKIKTLSPESSVLLKSNPTRKRQFMGRTLELWNKDKIPTIGNIKEKHDKTLKVKYPSKLSHLRYTDSIGRINKGTVWFVYQVKDTSLVLHVYNKVQFEVSPEEFDNLYDDPYTLIPGLSKDCYVEKFDMDNVNAGRAADLNLSFIIDWNSGKGFPMGVSVWNKVKTSLQSVFDSIVNSVKYTSVCMSYGNDSFESLGCYQTMSLDFLVDNKANTWILQCNTKPWVGHGKWWSKFDPGYKHIIDKWEYLDSVLNLTVDQYIKPRKPSSVNYKKHWTQLIDITKRKFGHPKVYRNVIAPIEGIQDNSNYSKNILKALNDRGWSIFPWKKYLDSPDFVWQGVGTILRGLFEEEKYDKEQVLKIFPNILKSKIVNRIFPLSVYLGNKSMLIKVLKQNLPNNWHNVIPWGFPIYKDKSDWKSDLIEKCEKGKILYNKQNLTWIIKPSHGLQGLGIIVSDDVNKLINHIENSKDKIWVLSLYIDNPLLLKKKKNHIRVFVLIHRDKTGINGYLFGRHFVFMAPVEYNKCQKSGYPDDEKDYCNLTNLSVGAKYYEKIGKDPKDAYADLSGIAQDEFDTDSFKSLYKKFKNTDKYKKMEQEFSNKNKDLEKSFYNIVMLPQIRKIVHDTIYASSPHIACIQENEKTFEGCFQYTAFDLMFDDGDKGNDVPKCWLLEVNTAPGLRATTSQGADRVLQFLNNMFDIVIHKKEKIPKKGKYKQLFNKVYTLDKKVTPKLASLVSDQLIFEKIQDKYNIYLPDLSKYKKIQDIPSYVKKVKLPDSIKKNLKDIKNKKKHPKLNQCLADKNTKQLKIILKKKKISYSGLNKIQMCYLINKLKLI
jgi:hypothetical protein